MNIQDVYKQMAAQLSRTVRQLTNSEKKQTLEWTLGWTPTSDSITTAHFADGAISGGADLIVGSFRGKPVYDSDLRRTPELQQHEGFTPVLGEGCLDSLRFD